MIDLLIFEKDKILELDYNLGIISKNTNYNIHNCCIHDDNIHIGYSAPKVFANIMKSDFFIMCMDFNYFSEYVDHKKILTIIQKARAAGANIILGGLESFEDAIPISEDLFWVSEFSGAIYAVIFKEHYHTVFAHDRFNAINLENFNKLSSNKFVINQPILQKKIALSNGKEYHKQNIASGKLETIKTLTDYFKGINPISISQKDIDSFCIPTYVINLEDRADRLSHIKDQFQNRPEFDLHITKAVRHEIGAVGLWKSICNIIEIAKANKYEIILIAEDDHEFTVHYDRNNLVKTIIEAYFAGVDILNGGIQGGFNHSFPIARNRFWVNCFWGTQFFVVHSKFFDKILNSYFSEQDTADNFISSLTIEKMVFFPFISVQKDFGYSDINLDNFRGDLSKLFKSAEHRLQTCEAAYIKFVERTKVL